MKSFSFILALAAIGITGCYSKGPKFNAHLRGVPASFSAVTLSNKIEPAWLRPALEPYVLGPGDVIDIEMIGEAQVKSSTTVGPDGKIYYSLLPGLSVWGLTLAETTELLKAETAKFTRVTPEPVVTLRVAASKRVSILGSVPNPGVYPLPAPMTVLEAISTAGGIPAASGLADDGADFSKSFVLRSGHFVPIDFEKLLKRGDLSQNIYLQPDDFVFIRPASVASVYVLGAVASPNIIPFSRDRSSVAGAIITAGGMQKYAQKSRVAIIRGGLAQPRIADVDYQAIVKGRTPDVLLEPGDIVYVPFVPYRYVVQLAESILDQFVRTVAVNEGQAIGNPRAQPTSVSSPFGGAPAR
jgi:polysaccharide biosynthesis/export protein